MKINEIIANTQRKPAAVTPSIIKQQGRVGQVVTQIASNDQQQPATEKEKVLAMWRYRDLKKQADKNYAARLRQQLANADAAAK